MLANLKKYRIVLASKSPRRQQLLSELGVKFDVISPDVDESFPNELMVSEVAVFLAQKKAVPFEEKLSENDLIITADTIVVIDGEILGKPSNYDEAFNMLEKLSGKTHQVITGVHLLSMNQRSSFEAVTHVHFKTFSREELDYYITNFQPYDKAGAYGVQEWIGHIGVERIEGSYFNVMGLPVQKLYELLRTF
jgi:septum formation protein